MPEVLRVLSHVYNYDDRPFVWPVRSDQTETTYDDMLFRVINDCLLVDSLIIILPQWYTTTDCLYLYLK